MVQINLSLLFVVVSAGIVPTLGLPQPLFHLMKELITHRMANNAANMGSVDGSQMRRRFYGGDSDVFARDVGFDSDLYQREPSWDAILHPIVAFKENRKRKAMKKAADADVDAKIDEEHNEALYSREYFSEAIAERSFDDFDFEARDFEEEY